MDSLLCCNRQAMTDCLMAWDTRSSSSSSVHQQFIYTIQQIIASILLQIFNIMKGVDNPGPGGLPRKLTSFSIL